MFKFDLGQIVFYFKNNIIHSAPVLSRMFVDNKIKDYVHTVEQIESFWRFGKERKVYATIHGEFYENELFASKEDLKNSL